MIAYMAGFAVAVLIMMCFPWPVNAPLAVAAIVAARKALK